MIIMILLSVIMFFKLDREDYFTNDEIGICDYKYELKFGKAPKIIAFNCFHSPFDSPNFISYKEAYNKESKLIPSFQYKLSKRTLYRIIMPLPSKS